LLFWEQMATQAAERRRERERRKHARAATLDEYAGERQQLAAIANRNERAEQARELRTRQEATAARFDAEATMELEQLTRLLPAAAAEPVLQPHFELILAE
jgi:hypothetical protein